MADPVTTLNGRFRLDRLVGQGGFARVFLSTDLLLDRQVAVKVLRPDQITGTDASHFLERFEAEARLIARLEHPNILGLHDYGQSDDLTYFVMPYMAGGSLHDARRRAGRFSPAVAAGYLRQAAAALDYAHRHNVVHRDIKPQNMLLREDGAQLLVADFGIAKVLREESGQSSTAVIGSAAYMAPEQFQGRVGRATDIYALGCVAHELLTGTPPYPGTVEQCMFGHIYGESPRLDAILPDAPPALQAVIDRALAKQPDDRFPSAGSFIAAFDAALVPPSPGEQPVQLDPPPPRSETTAPGAEAPPAARPAGAMPDPADRRLRIALAAGLVALLMLIGVGYALGPWRDGNGATATPPVGTRTAFTLPGHTGRVEYAAWSPDGKSLATAGEDTTVRWWREDGQLVRELAGHTVAVRSLAWSPHGTFLATGGKDGNVLIWRADSATPIVPFKGNGDAISALSWSPDGNFLVAASDLLRFYRTDTWAEAISYPGDGVNVLSWSPDGTLLAAGAGKGSLRLFRDDTSLAATLTGHTGDVTGIAWSPDSARFASAGGNLQLWEARSLRLLRPLDGHSGTVRSVAWSPDSEVIASGANDNTVRLWRPADGTSVSLAGHDAPVDQVAWLADGTLVSGDKRSVLRWWSADGTPLAQGKSGGCGVIRLAPAPAEPAVAATHGCEAAEIWR